MGKDRYGLDWNVWGQSPTKHKETQLLPYSTRTQPVQKKEKPEPGEVFFEQQPVRKNLTLIQPRFLPDQETMIGKQCAVTVEIANHPQGGTVSFELFAVFNNREYHFSRFSTVSHDGKTARTELPLERVEEYERECEKEPPDLSLCIEYYFRVSARGAEDVVSEKLILPYLDSAAQQIQRCTAQVAAGAAQECNSTVSTCTRCAKHGSEKADHGEKSEKAKMQSTIAETLTQAALEGAPMVRSCSTCSRNGKCQGRNRGLKALELE